MYRLHLLGATAAIIIGCSPGTLKVGNDNDVETAAELFAMELEQGSLRAACRKLDRVCQRSARGALACVAHTLYCADTAEQICARIEQTCQLLGVGCELHESHCAATVEPPCYEIAFGGPGQCVPYAEMKLQAHQK